MRKQCSIPPLCVDMGPVTTYLNDASVQATLGVTGIEWAPCNFDVNGGFTDWMNNYGSSIVPQMLEAGIRVAIYAGDVGVSHTCRLLIITGRSQAPALFGGVLPLCCPGKPPACPH